MATLSSSAASSDAFSAASSDAFSAASSAAFSAASSDAFSAASSNAFSAASSAAFSAASSNACVIFVSLLSAEEGGEQHCEKGEGSLAKGSKRSDKTGGQNEFPVPLACAQECAAVRRLLASHCKYGDTLSTPPAYRPTSPAIVKSGAESVFALAGGDISLSEDDDQDDDDRDDDRDDDDKSQDKSQDDDVQDDDRQDDDDVQDKTQDEDVQDDDRQDDDCENKSQHDDAQDGLEGTQAGTSADTCAGTRADTCAGTRADTCAGARADTCAGARADTCAGARADVAVSKKIKTDASAGGSSAGGSTGKSSAGVPTPVISVQGDRESTRIAAAFVSGIAAYKTPPLPVDTARAPIFAVPFFEVRARALLCPFSKFVLCPDVPFFKVRAVPCCALFQSSCSCPSLQEVRAVRFFKVRAVPCCALLRKKCVLCPSSKEVRAVPFFERSSCCALLRSRCSAHELQSYRVTDYELPVCCLALRFAFFSSSNLHLRAALIHAQLGAFALVHA